LPLFTKGFIFSLLDLTQTLLNDLLNFSHELIANRKIKWAKLLRNCVFEKVSIFKGATLLPASLPVSQPLKSRRDEFLRFKADELAQQMTLLDMELFQKIEIAEMFNYAKNQQDDQSPNLAIFGRHFDKMSTWVRTQICIQTKDKNREKYMKKFIMIMKSLMNYSNFNSYLSLLAALNAPEISRISCLKKYDDTLVALGKVFESNRNHALYRQTLLSAQPPCIPYIGLILQDLTFCHVGNQDLLDDKCSINFSKRWTQYNIVVNMKRFKNE
jgi:Rap guanine nucleotide exchange factor 1